MKTDSVINEVYATRRRISRMYGNDPNIYMAAMREKQAKADAMGISFLDFCLMQIGKSKTAEEVRGGSPATVCRPFGA